jgi:hypothetical protein
VSFFKGVLIDICITMYYKFFLRHFYILLNFHQRKKYHYKKPWNCDFMAIVQVISSFSTRSHIDFIMCDLSNKFYCNQSPCNNLLLIINWLINFYFFPSSTNLLQPKPMQAHITCKPTCKHLGHTLVTLGHYPCTLACNWLLRWMQCQT